MVFNIDIFIVIIYLILTLVIGIWKGRGIKDIKEYAIAQRNFSTPIIIATISATVVGASATFGLSQKIQSVGIIFFLVFMAYPINKFLTSEIIAPKMKKFYGMISTGDIMYSFYGKRGRVVSGILGTILSIGYFAAQISAVAHLFNYFFGIDYNIGAIIGTGVFILYSSFGGIKAVTTTDVVQFFILIFAIPLLCSLVLQKVGGYSNLLDNLPKDYFVHLMDKNYIAKFIPIFLMLCIPPMDPAITQRMLMTSNIEQMRNSMRITGFISIPYFFIITTIGMCAIVMKVNVGDNLIIPYFVSEILPAGIAGFVIAGLFSVLMSTGDSYLNTGSISFVQDTINPIFGKIPDNEKEVKLVKFVTLIFGTLALIVSLNFKNILDIVLNVLSFWIPIMLIPLLSGIFGIVISKNNFLLTIISSLFVYLLFKYSNIKIIDFYGIDNAIIPSMITNAVIFYTSYCFFDRKKNESFNDNLSNKA